MNKTVLRKLSLTQFITSSQVILSNTPWKGEEAEAQKRGAMILIPTPAYWPCFPSPQPLAITFLPSASVTLTSLDPPRSDIVQPFFFLCLTYFTQRSVPQVHPLCCVWQDHLPAHVV